MFDSDETMVVVSGRLTISVDDGRVVELSPGTMAFFPEGTETVWTVHETMRKAFHAVSDHPQELPSA